MKAATFHYLRRGALQKLLAVVIRPGPKGFAMVRTFSETVNKWSTPKLAPTTNLFQPVKDDSPDVARALKYADVDLTRLLLGAPEPARRKAGRA